MNGELNNSTVTAFLILTLLTLPIKALALWRSARYDQKPWFIALMVLNTVGMLDLAYLFYFAKAQKQKKTND